MELFVNIRVPLRDRFFLHIICPRHLSQSKIPWTWAPGRAAPWPHTGEVAVDSLYKLSTMSSRSILRRAE